MEMSTLLQTSGSCCTSDVTQTNQARKVVLVGGTGRVGSSTARYLAANRPDLKLVLAGRNRCRGEELASDIGTSTRFQHVDVEDMDSLFDVLDGADLVIHSAGSFQQRKRCTVLEAAIEKKVPYIDVCDDLDHARLAKSFHRQAAEAGVPAIITSGLCPGISNLMAAELVRLVQREGSKPLELKYSYFIAGSGGAGPTVLATSFLLLKEQVKTYSRGKLVRSKAYSDKKIVDFGKGVGRRPVFLINLPEVATAHECLGIPSVNARYGSAPWFWNWIMGAIPDLEFITSDVSTIDFFVKLSDPAVRAIDQLVGGTVSMRVDLSCEDKTLASGIFTHPQLSDCAGAATAAFVAPILEGKTPPGVWYPEQDEAVPVSSRKRLLQQAANGTLSFELSLSQSYNLPVPQLCPRLEHKQNFHFSKRNC